ncbi:MAG: tRNA lysidine(34) synthetase TilS [Acidimicrobiales bacterium]
MDPVRLVGACHFPATGAVDLAVSGGPDSLGLLLLAREAGLAARVHHVDHHARPASTDDARFVRELCATLAVPCEVHDVRVAPGPNFEARARAARRAALPATALTGHTMDDVAETIVLNLLRGAGLDGLSPMIGDPTKPLVDLRRADLHAYVAASGLVARHDETNDSPHHLRNRVRHEVLPLLGAVSGRDVVPVLARQAGLAHDERRWLDELVGSDDRPLGDVDCRELRAWPVARLRRWLRRRLASPDRGDGSHPPSFDEIERVIAVVRGESAATEIAGGRRVARRAQRLRVQ